jgi:crossover junction endodeoxyribonuclease RuvC
MVAESKNHTPRNAPRIVERYRILGVDPGSRVTGYGVVDLRGNEIRHVAHGCLKIASTTGKSTIPLEDRLLEIYKGLTEIIETHRPDALSIEKVFFAKNAVAALKLGQARGAAILTAKIHGLHVVEYAPTEVKATIVGHGRAEKEQVARMLEIMLGKMEFTSFDASDGLALAVCHARVYGSHSTLGKGHQNTLTQSRSRTRMGLAESLGLTPENVGDRKRITRGKERS